jgi:hypothetical protein
MAEAGVPLNGIYAAAILFSCLMQTVQNLVPYVNMDHANFLNLH